MLMNGTPSRFAPKPGVTPKLLPGNNLEGEIPQVGNTFQWTDNLTKTMGNHTAKFGVDLRRQRFDQTLYFDVNGEQLLFGGNANDVGFDTLILKYFLGLKAQYVQVDT